VLLSGEATDFGAAFKLFLGKNLAKQCINENINTAIIDFATLYSAKSWSLSKIAELFSNLALVI